MAKLAINGGEKVRTKPMGVAWPIYDDREAEALTEVLRSGKWGSTSGSKVREFESAFAEFCNAKHALCLTNGTAALEVALRAAGVGPGDEVIVPPYTFIATASAVVMVGGIPVFVDIEPGTMNIDPAQIEPAITERTKAIIAVHIGGRPADMDGVMDVAKKHDLKVIEDACQAHGASWRNQPVGSVGDAGAFSFQSSKNINSGEGGAVVTNDGDFYLRCYSLVNVGRIPEGEWYQHEYLGSNYRMTEFQGAILPIQMSRWEEQQKRREENAAHLDSLLAEIDGISPLDDDPRVTRNAYHLYIFRYHSDRFNGKPKSRFLQALSAEGIGASGGYTPLHTSGMFQRLSKRLQEIGFYGGPAIDYAAVELPATQNACDNEACWFPQSRLLGPKEDMDDIAKAIKKIRESCEEL
ncbi:MAG: DegT/DnrJ/EryC1/StrS family aminotransferase [Planctomycetes bacterium]|nr:DegT/DnrJ/EryC1/StrS family aminotransferase [Planctomycetota bacterium]